MTAGEVAAAEIKRLREGPEWAPDGLVYLHEIADVLEEILPPLVNVFAEIPNGWNPAAQSAMRGILTDLLREMERAE